jgi:hypothetical protein
MPPGVAAPYQRGTGGNREARSQRERDDDAKKTVIVAGEFLRRVEDLAADPRIHPASGDLLGWYAEEVTKARAARDARRLAELAAEFDDDLHAGHIRRRHWWRGTPAALTADDDDEYANDDEYADDGQDDAGEPAAVLATPASIAAQQPRAQQRATWAEALAANGWRLYPVTQWDGCQVVTANGHRCTDQQTPHSTGAGWVCSPHHAALCDTIATINKGRGIGW